MTSKDRLRIVFAQEGSAEAQLVRDQPDLYNIGVTGESAYYPVHFFLKSERGETLRGVLGGIWGRLMDEDEAHARERGGHSATLDTHSFQARPFYEGRGYEVFGTLDDYPKGHKRFYLRRNL